MDEKTNNFTKTELKSQGIALEKNVKIDDKSSVDALSSRGYGTIETNSLFLSFYEALYLLDKKILKVKTLPTSCSALSLSLLIRLINMALIPALLNDDDMSVNELTKTNIP